MKTGGLLGGDHAPLAVTGIGVVSAAGIGVGPLMTVLRRQRSYLSEWVPPAGTRFRPW